MRRDVGQDEKKALAMAIQAGESGRKPWVPISIIAIVFGALFVVAGLWLVGAYVFSAIIERIGEPDQSLLFWYLPLVFMGIASLGLGCGAIAFGIIRHRRG